MVMRLVAVAWRKLRWEFILSSCSVSFCVAERISLVPVESKASLVPVVTEVGALALGGTHGPTLSPSSSSSLKPDSGVC